MYCLEMFCTYFLNFFTFWIPWFSFLSVNILICYLKRQKVVKVLHDLNFLNSFFDCLDFLDVLLFVYLLKFLSVILWTFIRQLLKLSKVTKMFNYFSICRLVLPILHNFLDSCYTILTVNILWWEFYRLMSKNSSIVCWKLFYLL